MKASGVSSTSEHARSVVVPPETEGLKQKAPSRNAGHIGWFPVRVGTWVYHNLRYMASEVMEAFHGNERSLPQRTIKTVFVGAGPVGLWTAIQHKLNNPEADIQMFDKYSDYKRSHTVRFDTGSFSGACMNEGLQALKSKIQEQHGRIACSELEKDLLKIAGNLGIQIRNNGAEVTKVGPDSITLKNGDSYKYDQLVGADGAHSKMRKALLTESQQVDFTRLAQADTNDEFSLRKEIQHRIRVRYQVRGDTRRLNRSWGDWAKLYYPSCKIIGSPVDEHVSKPDVHGNRTVTLDFFISADEYNSLHDNGYNLKKPAAMTDLQPDLAEKIRLWQGMKEKFAGEVQLPGTEQMTPYALSYFQARKVAAVTSKNKPAYLVGDSSTALPYFRSLNNGLLCGTRLGVSLSRGDRKPRRVTYHADSYANFVNLRARKEFLVARMKDRAVSLFNGFLKISNIVPWQLNYLGSELVKKLTARKRVTASSSVKKAAPEARREQAVKQPVPVRRRERAAKQAQDAEVLYPRKHDVLTRFTGNLRRRSVNP